MFKYLTVANYFNSSIHLFYLTAITPPRFYIFPIDFTHYSYTSIHTHYISCLYNVGRHLRNAKAVRAVSMYIRIVRRLLIHRSFIPQTRINCPVKF